MKTFKKLILALAALHLSACAVGPLVTHETARTVGKNNHELMAGFGSASYVAKWNYGLSENLDLGLHLEPLSFGVRAKYAFINGQESGWSLATALGAGISLGGSAQHADLMTSYFVKEWEPYMNVRLVHVKSDPVKLTNEDTGPFQLNFEADDFFYSEFTLGTRYWFTKQFSLSLEGSALTPRSSHLKVARHTLLGLAAGYRF